jgi:hypothetical protein
MASAAFNAIKKIRIIYRKSPIPIDWRKISLFILIGKKVDPFRRLLVSGAGFFPGYFAG